MSDAARDNETPHLADEDRVALRRMATDLSHLPAEVIANARWREERAYEEARAASAAAADPEL